MIFKKILIGGLLIVFGFFLGLNYAFLKISWQSFFKKSCSTDVKVCPDGQTVGRILPNCEFSPCPSLEPTAKQEESEGKFCGGIANIACPLGYRCVLEGKYPDAGGRCTKEKFDEKNFTCPKTGYIDCMPGPDKKSECNSIYLDWVKKNCPNFKGVAY